MDDTLVPEGSEEADAGDAADATSPDTRRSRRSRGPHVLLIDGDEATRKAIASSMRHAGYEVRTAQSGVEALDTAATHRPDLVIMEATLPGRLDGFETCRLLRLQVECPVIFVSGRTAEIDRVVGLEVGADDYVTKPFGMRELLARVAAHIRRAAMPMVESFDDDQDRPDGEWTDTSGRPTVGIAHVEEVGVRRKKGGGDPDILVFDGVTIDAVRREVRTGSKRISLKRREFDLLMYLARNHGIVLSRSQILRAVWPEEFQDYETRTVDVHVSRVRDKVEPDPARPRFIHTIRGTGYQFRVIPPPIEKRKEKHK
jgi:DNA-binding response OmpR family regulator